MADQSVEKDAEKGELVVERKRRNLRMVGQAGQKRGVWKRRKRKTETDDGNGNGRRKMGVVSHTRAQKLNPRP